MTGNVSKILLFCYSFLFSFAMDYRKKARFVQTYV